MSKSGLLTSLPLDSAAFKKGYSDYFKNVPESYCLEPWLKHAEAGEWLRGWTYTKQMEAASYLE